MKLRQTFYENLKQHYSSRKYKELITLNCSDRCIKTFREDDLTRTEMNCLMNCYNKYYRYMAYSTTLYTYITNSDKVDEYMKTDQNDLPPENNSPASILQGMSDSLAK